jgi:RNA polymerase primary sigma factor
MEAAERWQLLRASERPLRATGSGQEAASTLTGREADVVKLYFGLSGGHAHSLEEIGEKFDLTRERVRQIKEKAVRRLKHGSRSKLLKAYLG